MPVSVSVPLPSLVRLLPLPASAEANVMFWPLVSILRAWLPAPLKRLE